MNQDTSETLRTGFMLDGNRLYLIYDRARRKYRLGTRWVWLASFEGVKDACDAFEALELIDASNHQALGAALVQEIRRTPRTSFGHVGSNRMGRISYLVESVEKRLLGLRPQRCGTKGSVERWVRRASHPTSM